MFFQILAGVSGAFTSEQLTTVQLCLGNRLQYIEEDQSVSALFSPLSLFCKQLAPLLHCTYI